MPNKTAAALVLRDGDRPRLEALIRSTTVPAGVAQRARIVLLAAEGLANYEIAERVGVIAADGEPVAGPVRRAGAGRAGRGQRRRGGRGRVDRAKIDHGDVDAAAEESGGDALVVAGCWPTGWGSSTPRSPAIWKEYGVKPWKAETFKFSTDPELEAKVTDVVGLYLAPPENAIVLCVDEKSPRCRR